MSNRFGYGFLLVFAFLAGCAGRPALPPASREPASFASIAEPPAVDKNGSDWPEFRRNDQRTGNNPYQTAITASNAGTLKPKWTKKINPVFASPIVVNGVIYQGDVSGNLYAWNISDGSQVWRFSSGGSFIASPYYVPSTGVLYVGAKGFNSKNIPSKMYAINAATGQVKWSYSVANGAQIQGSALVTGGVVYFGTGAKDETLDECDSNKQLIALNATTGKLVSSLNIAPSGLTGGDIWSSPTLDPANRMYLATGNECTPNFEPFADAQAIMQVKPTQPQISVVWALQSIDGPGVDFDFGATPLYVDNMIVDTGKDSYTYAIAPTGKLVWETQSGPSIGSPATDGTRVFTPTTVLQGQCQVGDLCGAFVALNLSNGSVAWSIPVTMGTGQFSELTAPAVSNGVVYAAFNNAIWALDAATGSTLWSYPTSNQVFGGITVVNGGVLAGEMAPGGTFYCFTPNGK